MIGFFVIGSFLRWNAKPLNRIANLEDLGYVPDMLIGDTQRVAKQMQRIRKIGDCPPVYPNGWFGLIESRFLAKGECRNVIVLGLNLALFRDSRGHPHVLDAYCPHNGANIAVGGQVIGDCIECPFHGWQFRGEDGICTHIPYLKGNKIPNSAILKSHIVKEINGWIYLWFDAENRKPFWEIPEIHEINEHKWTYQGRTQHTINAHIEEVPENAADISHLGQVHGPAIFMGRDLRFIYNKWSKYFTHKWTVRWEAGEEDEEKHIGKLYLLHELDIFGIKFTPMNFALNGLQIGPGIVYLFFESFFGKGIFMQSLVPIEPLTQRLVHNIYTEWRIPNIVAKFFMLAECCQVERDVMIWNNKSFVNSPCYVKSPEDSLIAKHRRWYKQFYSENSPRLTDTLNKLEF